jgi:hypothetical protein
LVSEECFLLSLPLVKLEPETFMSVTSDKETESINDYIIYVTFIQTVIISTTYQLKDLTLRFKVFSPLFAISLTEVLVTAQRVGSVYNITF